MGYMPGPDPCCLTSGVEVVEVDGFTPRSVEPLNGVHLAAQITAVLLSIKAGVPLKAGFFSRILDSVLELGTVGERLEEDRSSVHGGGLVDIELRPSVDFHAIELLVGKGCFRICESH